MHNINDARDGNVDNLAAPSPMRYPRAMRASLLLVALALPSLTPRAQADPELLRMASVTPAGTAWAREIGAFSRDVEKSTNGLVRVKWYLGAIAGDEAESLARIRRGQLDGAAISVSCSDLAPSLRATRVVGIFQGRDEARHVFSRLFPIVEQEMRQAGFTAIAISAFGADIIFSRRPIRSFAELRQLRPWVWDLDQVWRVEWPMMGVGIVPLPVQDALAAADRGAIDGYLALPTAALAYQWSAQMKFYTPLPIGYLPGCLVIANRALDPLPMAAQQAIRTAGAKLGARFDEVNASLEAQLLGGLFERQGLKPVPVTAELRSQFFDESRRARDALPGSLVPPLLIDRINSWLADHRAENQAR